MKMIFYSLAFNENELYQMFKDFYFSFIPGFVIGPTELTSIIEMMA